MLENEAAFVLHSYPELVFAAGKTGTVAFLRDCEVKKIVRVSSGFTLILCVILSSVVLASCLFDSLEAILSATPTSYPSKCRNDR